MKIAFFCLRSNLDEMSERVEECAVGCGFSPVQGGTAKEVTLLGPGIVRHPSRAESWNTILSKIQHFAN